MSPRALLLSVGEGPARSCPVGFLKRRWERTQEAELTAHRVQSNKSEKNVNCKPILLATRSHILCGAAARGILGAGYLTRRRLRMASAQGPERGTRALAIVGGS